MTEVKEVDELELGGEFTYVQELPRLQELLGAISRVGASETEADEVASQCVEITEILDKYQLQPALLDPHLEMMLAKLFVPIKANAPVLFHPVARVVYFLAKVRGYKTVVKFFPHEVKDLEPSFDLLLAQGEPGDTTNWETRYVLLLWISIVARVPFDLASIDTSESDAGAEGSLLDRIMNLAMSYLSQPTKTRDGAAVLIAQLLTRRDVQPQLIRFTDWANEQLAGLAGGSSDSQDLYLICGVFAALAGLFKSGERGQLRNDVVPRVFNSVVETVEGATSTTQRMLAVKLVQRMGLTYLEPRNQQWRYTRSLASLEKNLTGSDSSAPPAVGVGIGGVSADVEEDDDFDVPEEVEEVIHVLLTHLKDSNTVVRWSAAKGIGRITGRLPLALADEVLSAVLELLSAAERDAAWHGACLALAELCRRGLILPERLDSVLPLVYKALVYEVPRSHASIGDNVRDAACYVAWAFARAFHPSIVAPHMDDLSSWLIVSATTDREVHCRRAASAALQEAAGRQGAQAFPMGIDIITCADYVSLGQRTQALIEVLPEVAAMGGGKYSVALAHHLVDNKMRHWEASFRELSARALGQLAKLSGNVPALRDCLMEDVLPSLLEVAAHRLLPVRHGAIWGIAELILGLKESDTAIGSGLSSERQSEVAAVVERVESAQLYRGKGGELMHGAVCRLIECIARSDFTELERATVERLQCSLDQQLKEGKLEVVEGAIPALRHFCATFYLDTGDAEAAASLVARLPEKYLCVLDSCVNPSTWAGRDTEATRGYCLGLGALPGWLLVPMASRAVETLSVASRPLPTAALEMGGADDADLRRNALKGLGGVCAVSPPIEHRPN